MVCKQSKRNQRTDNAARIIQAAVESKGEAAVLGIHGLGNERIARRGPQSFTDSIGNTNCQQPWPAPDKGNSRATNACKTVSQNDPGLRALGAVNDDTRNKLEQTGRHIRQAFNKPQHLWTSHEHRRQIQRNQRVKHLAGTIIDQAHQAYQPNRAGETENIFNHHKSLA